MSFQMPRPASTLPRLLLSMCLSTALAAVVSFVLVFVLSGGPESIDSQLPASGPIGSLISQIVPFVWLGLFGGLGAAYWFVSSKTKGANTALLAIYALILLCAIYPIIAFAVENPLIAIVGNIITIFAACLTAGFCWRVSRPATVFPTLVALWVSVATLSLAALYW